MTRQEEISRLTKLSSTLLSLFGTSQGFNRGFIALMKSLSFWMNQRGLSFNLTITRRPAEISSSDTLHEGSHF
jgi:hypothetical protein